MEPVLTSLKKKMSSEVQFGASSGSTANRVDFVKRLFTTSESESSKDGSGKKSPASVNKKNGPKGTTLQQPIAIT